MLGPCVLLRKAKSLTRLLITHDTSDTSAYWKERASFPGSTAVLWMNPHVNDLIRQSEMSILSDVLNRVPINGAILDIGCGIGFLTRFAKSIRPDCNLTGIDFSEMIARAKTESSDQGIEWIEGSFIETKFDKEFDLVFSFASLSMVRNPDLFQRALFNVLSTVKNGGTLLLVEPFHTSNLLARAKISRNTIARNLSVFGFQVNIRKGIIFWPFRILFFNSNLSRIPMKGIFLMGEFAIKLFGDAFSDYKILLATRKSFHK